MDYASLLRRFSARNQLHTVLVELTYSCNLDCFFCYNDRGSTVRPLSLEQYFRFFEDLRGMAVMNLALSGGEPLVHPEFFDIARRARELGFVIRVKTNGHTLAGETALRLKDQIDPFQVDISIHGARAESHDRQTRVRGSFDRVMANIAGAVDCGLRVKLNCVLTQWNEGEIDEMYRLAESLGVLLVINPAISPRDDGGLAPLDIAPTTAGLVHLYRMQQARAAEVLSAGEQVSRGAADESTGKPEAWRVCGAGSSTIAVDPSGNVLPCVQWRRSAGNLHEQSIEEIWRTSPVLEEIRRVTEEAAVAVREHDSSLPLVGFCPGLAELATGDPQMPYPAVLRESAARRSAREGGGDNDRDGERQRSCDE